MRKTVFIVLCGLTAFACSGDKGTEPPVEGKFSLNTTSLHLTAVATAVWPVTGNVTLTNVADDSITFDFKESCDWLCANRSTVKLGGGDTAQIQVTVTMSSLAEGQHIDTLKVIDTGIDGKSKFLVVNVTATPDSTYPEFLNPTDSSIYVDEYWGSYCYQFSSAWILQCRSNSGNPIKVFAYEAWSGEKLQEIYFADLTLAPGDSLPGRIGFSGCLPYPPPLRAWWYVKVGYRVGDEVRWAIHIYVEF